MNLFEVYSLFPVEPVSAKDVWVYDRAGIRYLDLYGGHAVISIGHTHPHYVNRLQHQLNRIGFYSNSVENSLQIELAQKLGDMSGYPDYRLFLCNSGAEAMENALKLASFQTGRKKMVAFSGAFHGRTSAAVAITDNPKIQAPINSTDHVVRVAWNDLPTLASVLASGAIAAVIIESIQGVGGIHVPFKEFLVEAAQLCKSHGTMLIIDEIQAGFGRSGKFFAHQHLGVKADLVTMAKGMGNGFPVGGVLIGPSFEAWPGMLGTTFGGNHLACAASLAVLETLDKEDLISHAANMGQYLQHKLSALPQIQQIRGLGLMLGLELPGPAKEARKQLLFEHQIFTGSSSQPNVLRLLPPLTIQQTELDYFVSSLQSVLETLYSPAANA